jgi:hypothetical protein
MTATNTQVKAFISGYLCKEAQEPQRPILSLLQYLKRDPKLGQKDFESLVGALGISKQNFGGNISPQQVTKLNQMITTQPQQALNALKWHQSQKKNPYRFSPFNKTGFNLLPQYLDIRRKEIAKDPAAWQTLVDKTFPKPAAPAPASAVKPM